MESRWRDADAAALPDLDGLVYASRLVGADQSLVLWGGGNTSAKLVERDFRDRETRVLRVKGSGSDLRTIQRKDFPGVRLDDVLPLEARGAMPDEAMVAYLAHTLMEPSSPRPSIETLLHAFLPATFIMHTHADAILALTNTPHGPRWMREALGEGAVWVDYQRPGFALSCAIAAAYRGQPHATAIVMEKHGLITWGATAHAAYEATVATVSHAEAFIAARHGTRATPGYVSSAGDVHARTAQAPAAGRHLDESTRRRIFATLAPRIRGLAARTTPKGQIIPPEKTYQVPAAARTILRFDAGEDVLAFASHPEAARLSNIGPATPDHLLNTKRTALYVPAHVTADPDALAESLATALEPAWQDWAASYVSYARQTSQLDSGTRPPQIDPRPQVLLLPGVGMVTLGRDARAAAISADLYRHAAATVLDAEAVDAYTSLDEADCFDVEFWPLELYKLTLAPPEPALARRVALVTGAASGIGRAIAARLAQDGAHVVIGDIDGTGAQAAATDLCRQYGAGRATGLAMDVTSEASVSAAFEATCATFGGLDILVSNAGIAPFSAIADMDLAIWQRSLDVNATGHFLVTREAVRLLARQGTGGSIIFITTKNVMAPGKDFGAYSAAKAAQAQLARVVAMEAADIGVRVNMINPDAVFRGSGLWSPELRRARAQAHGVTEAALGDFYQQRSLLGLPVLPEDVAEAACWLASDRASKTTGTVLTVDSGVPAAFPR